MKLLGSMSKLDPSMTCPAAVQLPQRPVPEWVREIGERNTAKHRYLELVALGVDPILALGEVTPAWSGSVDDIANTWEWAGPKARLEIDRGTRDLELLVEWVVHIAMTDAVPIVTAWGERHTLPDGALWAPRTPGVLGIADVVVIDHQRGVVEVTDYKFGRPPSVEWSRQLAALGYCAQQLTGYRVALAVEYPDSRGRCRRKQCWLDEVRAPVDECTLAEAWQRGIVVRDALAAGEPPPLWPGWWCRSKCYAVCVNNPPRETDGETTDAEDAAKDKIGAGVANRDKPSVSRRDARPDLPPLAG